MALIPREEIERIKREADILHEVRSRGTKLTKCGQDEYKGLCPLRPETNPSFFVNPVKNCFYCHGCGKSGGVIKFVQLSDSISFRHAVEKLRGNGNLGQITLPTMKNSTDEAIKQKLKNRVVDYYHQTFLKEQEGQAYLQQRGIYSVEAITRFKIGYSNKTLAYVVPPASEHRPLLQEIGIFNARTGHELFAGSVIIPVIDQHGNVQEIYGRKTKDHLRKGTAYHLYLPGQHSGVWNSDAFISNDEIILCESASDALTFYVNGFKNVTFSYGVNGFTNEHLRLMKEHGILIVFIAYDNDKAGNTAANKLAEKLAKEGITTYRLRFPHGLDANLYAQKVTPAEKSLAVLFDDPQLLGGKACSFTVPASIGQAAKEVIAVESGDLPVSLAVVPGKNENPAAAKEEMSGTSESGLTCPDPGPDKTRSLPTNVELKKTKNGVYCTIRDRSYRIRGLEKNKSYEVMKVCIRASCDGSYYLDTVDLVQERQRRTFIRNAADELGLNKEIVKRDLGNILLVLEEMQEEILEDTSLSEPEIYQMSDAERKAALSYLKSPDLIERLMADFHTCGIVKEDTNLFVGYLATLSRKFEDPLAVMLQASPSSGKSTVMDAILDFVPEEDKRVYTYMTGQSLFYEGENELVHKVLAIEEDEGAEKASYSLKTMQSEKRIAISTTGTDPQTGRNKTFTSVVNGPMTIFLCSTKPFVDEEFMHRFMCLGTDESREQTNAVHKRQRENETLRGMIRKERGQHLKHLHRNIQRLLEPVRVINQYAANLTFPSNNLRTRRDQMKYLTMVRAIAFLFQYQRPRHTRLINGIPCEYIEVVIDDIKHAYKLSCETMGRTLDELAPQTRNLLNMLLLMVREACDRLSINLKDYRFGQKEIREYTGWSAYQVKVHMSRLVDLEYVYCHATRNGRRYEYELVYDGSGDTGQRFVLGIADIEKLDTIADSE